MSASLLERITIEAGKCGGRPCIRGKRIRVTDILELLAITLGWMNIDVETAGDYATAVKRLGSEAYDLVLTDMRLLRPDQCVQCDASPFAPILEPTGSTAPGCGSHDSRRVPVSATRICSSKRPP